MLMIGSFKFTAISGGPNESPISGFNPKIGALQILDTTKSTLALAAKINVTNPTEYAATVPYVNLHLLCNGTLLGHAVARNLSLVPGPNHNLEVTAVWNPTSSSTDGDGDDRGVRVGRELISQYISGKIYKKYYNPVFRIKQLSIPPFSTSFPFLYIKFDVKKNPRLKPPS